MRAYFAFASAFTGLLDKAFVSIYQEVTRTTVKGKSNAKKTSSNGRS